MATLVSSVLPAPPSTAVPMSVGLVGVSFAFSDSGGCNLGVSSDTGCTSGDSDEPNS